MFPRSNRRFHAATNVSMKHQMRTRSNKCANITSNNHPRVAINISVKQHTPQWRNKHLHEANIASTKQQIFPCINKFLHEATNASPKQQLSPPTQQVPPWSKAVSTALSTVYMKQQMSSRSNKWSYEAPSMLLVCYTRVHVLNAWYTR